MGKEENRMVWGVCNKFQELKEEERRMQIGS